MQIATAKAGNNMSFFAVLQNLDKEQAAAFAVQFWSICKQRNNLICTKERIYHHTFVYVEISYFSGAVQSAETTAANNRAIKWSKPSIIRFKCNTDTDFSTTLNWVGIGVYSVMQKAIYFLQKQNVKNVDGTIEEVLRLLLALINWVRGLQLKISQN